MARVSSSSPAISADIENGGRTPWSSGARWRTIARNSSRAGVEGSWSGPSSSATRGLLIRGEEQEPEQLLLDRRDRGEDPVDRQRVGRGEDGVGGDPALGGRAARRRPAMEDLQDGALLDARHVVDLLEVGVAHHRVRDRPQRRRDRVDEAGLAAGRLEVDLPSVEVDEVVDDRLGGPDLLAPAIGRLADDLVGILAVGQADDADLVELDAGVGRRQLADQRLERLRPERPGLLAGRVDVVGERDLLRVAREERRPGPGVSAVPSDATTLSKPAWWAISASV